MATPPPKPGPVPAGKTIPTSGSPAQHRNLSRERIAEDMAAFNSAGGQVEVLGNTPFRTKPSPEKPAVASGKRPASSGNRTDKPGSP